MTMFLDLAYREPNGRHAYHCRDALLRKYVILPFQVGHVKLTVLVTRS